MTSRTRVSFFIEIYCPSIAEVMNMAPRSLDPKTVSKGLSIILIIWKLKAKFNNMQEDLERTKRHLIAAQGEIFQLLQVVIQQQARVLPFGKPQKKIIWGSA
jgi:hypothetical protein